MAGNMEEMIRAGLAAEQGAQQQGPSKEQQWRMQAMSALHALAAAGKYHPRTLKQWTHDCDQLAAYLDRGTIAKSTSMVGDHDETRRYMNTPATPDDD